MITVKPFRAVRPIDNNAAVRVAALPYDVMSAEEAREMTAGNPDSFLHVDKAEIDLPPETDPYSPEVYAKARENLAGLLSRGALTRDADRCFYLYRQIWQGRAQIGIVGCPVVDDYLEERIKKHELTRADKEEDRVRHVDTLNAQTGPIFLAHRPDARIDGIVSAWTGAHAPLYDFGADGGVRHTVWKVDDPDVCEQIQTIFAETDALYIADGHHRCASAARVAQLRRAAQPDYTGDEEFNSFLAVIFPADQLRIMDYNRVVRDLNGRTPTAFLEALGEKFDWERFNGAPSKKHEFGMYLNDGGAGTWYRLVIKEACIDRSNPVASLDASLLQENLLAPILGIADPRTDRRIDFVGGIRGLGELQRRADAFAIAGIKVDGSTDAEAGHTASDAAVAFALYPVSLDDLMAVSDAGQIMPPKSTWFEPKLLSGLFIHELCDK